MAASLFNRKVKMPNPDLVKICRFKKGDRLQVMTGKEKDKIGNLQKILTSRARVIIEGVNMLTRHVKPNPNTGQTGGRLKSEGSIHVSNVALVCPKCLKPTKVAYKILAPEQVVDKNRKKIRICKRCDAPIDD
ncbi:MAG: 50S ribosomal protein L24 [Deltaproteobacteria bacterium]|jgi:large subunit ribosomal protein L24|nr:50S ribosomal protein L24 [Deltaproteobacteria bacterium]